MPLPRLRAPHRHPLFFAAVAAVGLAACEGEIAPPPPSTVEAPSPSLERAVGAAYDGRPIDPARELVITDRSVVVKPDCVRTGCDKNYWDYIPGKVNTDAEGGFSFGRLIDNMLPASLRASGAEGARLRGRFLLAWLRTWDEEQIVNGFRIPAKPHVRTLLVEPWLEASGCARTATECALDMNKAPFRLLAVVYRPDLRKKPQKAKKKSGDLGSAGEGRFVWGAMAPHPTTPGAKVPLEFTIIFEYMMPVSGESDLLGVAEKYHDLSKRAFGKDHRDKLHSLTREYTKQDVAPWRPNGSALLQIRTNEIAPRGTAGRIWEMREFVLAPAGTAKAGLLVPDTMKNEMDQSLDNTETLARWVTANADAVRAGTHSVPATLTFDDNGQSRTVAYLAASAPVPSRFKWKIPGVAEELRHKYAVATCSGCHRAETGPLPPDLCEPFEEKATVATCGTPFVHIANRIEGERSNPDDPTSATFTRDDVLSLFLRQELAGPRARDYASLLKKQPGQVDDGNGLDRSADPLE